MNAGIGKDTYLGSPFALTFPTVDVITGELKCLGRGGPSIQDRCEQGVQACAHRAWRL